VKSRRVVCTVHQLEHSDSTGGDQKMENSGQPSGHQERSADGVGGESNGGAAEEDAEAGHDQRGVESGHSGNRPHLILPPKAGIILDKGVKRVETGVRPDQTSTSLAQLWRGKQGGG